MATMATVQAQVDAEVVRRATEVLGRSGLTVEDAIRQMLTRAADEGSLPFPLNGDVTKSGGKDPAYDAWFRAKVQAALDDPRPLISSEEVDRRAEQRRIRLLERAQKLCA